MTTTATLQRMLANGNWTDAEARRAHFVQLAADRKGVSTQEVEARLAAGDEMSWDSDWYARIRLAPVAGAPARAPLPRGGLPDLGAMACPRCHGPTSVAGEVCDDCAEYA